MTKCVIVKICSYDHSKKKKKSKIYVLQDVCFFLSRNLEDGKMRVFVIPIIFIDRRKYYIFKDVMSLQTTEKIICCASVSI